MNTPKAIFIDVDGTLLSHGTKQVPKSAIDALRYACEKGILLFIATGRSKTELGMIARLRNMPFDGFVTMNGAYCHAGDEVIFKNPLHPADVAAVLNRIAHNPFPCAFCEENDLYINIINELVKELQKSLNLPLPPLGDPQRALGADIYQIVAFGAAQEEAFLRDLPYSKVTRWMEGGYDVVNATVNKWEGILHMLCHFGIKPREAAAIGDGENDIEMLANVGYSVAMGNADDSVKKCAKFVTGHIDDDGFAEAVGYLLSPKKP
jgi:Cof subfamily protein (haloacid dehalogenase superfamily)